VAASLSSADCSTEVDGSYELAIGVAVNGTTFGRHRAVGKVVARPACEYYDLEAMGLLSQEFSKPVHPRVVTLDQLIVENHGRA